MRRALSTLVIGVSLAFAADVEAQRGRVRNTETERARDGRVERLEPVHAPGRVVQPVYRTPPRDHRARVVYTSGVRYPAYRYGHAWVRVDWARVRYAPVPVRHRRAFLNQGELRRLLGHDSIRMVRDAGRQAGLRGSLRGHWVADGPRSLVLVVSMDGFDVAEFVDFEGDGFIDDVFLVGPAGGRRAGYGW